ncbi:hypothetical protein BGX23_011141 [Mortierella sp. AD031]|nr:hypothetical protein BGX23_011141 [Mortierella sp. AD031]
MSTSPGIYDPHTLMETIQGVMTNLDSLRKEELAGIASVHESASGPDAKPTYIVRGKEEERSQLLITRIRIYKESITLNRWLAHLPDREAEFRQHFGMHLATELTALMKDMMEEEEALAATLSTDISPKNRFLLYEMRKVIMMIDEALDKVCEVVLVFGSPPFVVG